jgi:hypothetical protein
MMATRFVDEGGTEWAVWEIIERRELADAPPTEETDDVEDATWLRFDSDTQRRRLTRYPGWWEAMGASELSALCALARPEPAPMPMAVAVETFDGLVGLP